MQNQNRLNIVLIRLIISCTRMKNVAKAYSNMYMYIEKEIKWKRTTFGTASEMNWKMKIIV